MLETHAPADSGCCARVGALRNCRACVRLRVHRDLIQISRFLVWYSVV